jgi:hypothetical protein
MGTGGVVRGCGTRSKGGIYLECPLSPYGLPLEHFLCDPPVLIDVQQFGITPVGVKLMERNGVWHIVDWVGSTHYPNVADFVEEVRNFGLSRRLPQTLDFKKLTPDSRILLVHSRAWIDNFQAYYDKEEDCGKLDCDQCPKHLKHHENKVPHSPSEPCIRLWYQDLTDADPNPDHPPRGVVRKMPSFEYKGLSAPEGVEPEYKVAIFGSFPVHNLAVINDPDGGLHHRSMNLAGQARVPVNLEDE